MKTRLLLTLVLMATLPLRAATYYVDYASGSDASAGTGTNTAWKRHPYMQGWAGSYSHSAGDRFIFKGGVSWPNSCFPMTISAGGTAGAVDYYGVDKSWFIGVSWTRPKFDFSGSTSTTSRVVFSGVSYVDFDNFELAGMVDGSTSVGQWPHVACTDAEYSSYITVKNCYAHGWTAQYDGTVILWFYSSPNCSALNNLIDGTESLVGTNGIGLGIAGALNIVSNYIKNLPTAVQSAAGVQNSEVSWNTVDTVPRSISAPIAHENGLYIFGGGRVFNNVIHDTVDGAQPLYIEAAWGNVANTNYVFNNLVYNVSGAPCIPIDYEYTTNQLDTYTYIANNTLVSGGANIMRCAREPYHPQFVLFTNNLFICDEAVFDSNANSLQCGNNLTNSHAAATASGYTLANQYKPTSASSPTVGTGLSLSSTFTTDLLGATRATPWDIGAYEYSTTPTNPPASAIGGWNVGALSVDTVIIK